MKEASRPSDYYVRVWGEQFPASWRRAVQVNSATRVRGCHVLAGKTLQPFPAPQGRLRTCKSLLQVPSNSPVLPQALRLPVTPESQLSWPWDDSFPPTFTSPLSPPALQLRVSEGLLSRPSQGAGWAHITVTTTADSGTAGGRNRHPDPISFLLSFLMLFDSFLLFSQCLCLFCFVSLEQCDFFLTMFHFILKRGRKSCPCDLLFPHCT